MPNVIKRLYELTDQTDNDNLIQEQIEEDISRNRDYFYEKKRKK
jgi:hypothetical protein